MLQKKRLSQCRNILGDLLQEMEDGEVDHIDEETDEIVTECYRLINRIDSILAATAIKAIRTKEGGGE